VFDTMLERATRHFGNLWTYAGSCFHAPGPPAMLSLVPRADVLPFFSSGMNASFPVL
jgi:hypothetical protein